MRILISIICCITFSFIFLSCKQEDSNENANQTNGNNTNNCSTQQLEQNLNLILSTTNSEVDFSFVIERVDGRRFSYNRGNSSLNTLYESASTSKLVTSVVILRLVDQGYLSLIDKPQNHISTWPIGSSDSLYNMSLKNLLSFTSGLTTEPNCINLASANFQNCVNTIATTNANNGLVPGSQFYYSGTHMQVAGLMAIKARGVSNWQDIFTEFKNQTGLFATSSYDLPSSTNPRLAGGMHWTGAEYLNFLKTLRDGSLLSSTSLSQLITDHIAYSTIAYSPTITGLNEDWHYGLGIWHECKNSSFNCTPGQRLSSPGAYGAYPFWDRTKNYIGLVARQGTLGTYTNGIAIERSVQDVVDQWATCSNP